MITFRCPKCQSVQNVYALPGTAFVTCSTCAARLQMPSVPTEAVSATPETRPLTAPKKSPARADEWFCTIDGQHRGPLTEADVQRLVDREELRPADLVWRNGWPQWKPARQFFQFPEPRPRPRRREYDDDRFDDRFDDDRYDDRIRISRHHQPDNTASVTCGILAIIGGVMSCIPCFVGIGFGVAGLVLAVVSMSQGQDKTLGGIGLGFSITGMVMNVLLHAVVLMR